MFRLEGYLDTPQNLPTDLGAGDAGRIWVTGYIWHIWAGAGWRRAIATTTAPEATP